MSAPALRRTLLRPALFGARFNSTIPAPPLPPTKPTTSPNTAYTSPNTAYSGLLNYLAKTSDPSAASATSELDLNALSANPFGGLNAPVEEHRLSIYATKHNTHITFSDPQGKALISVSAGNLGFKKGNRGSYDAAYQLAAHVFRSLEDAGVRPKALEVVLRGFGQGRDSVTKALLGQEGRYLKGVVSRVTDSTRLKFGGTRSPKPRRLG